MNPGINNKKIIILFSILIIVILSAIYIFYTIQPNQSQTKDFSFPRDEGRHQGFNESWYICFDLTSEKGHHYSFHAQYALQSNDDTCFKICSLTNISAQKYTYHIFQESPDDYTLDTSKLNITYDYFWEKDRWYQREKEPFNYNFSVGLLDNKAELILLNCTLTSNKKPIRINDTPLNKEVFNDETNKIWYYAQTNIDVDGTLLYNNKEIPVTGTAWIDREWGERIMTKVEWFAIQLKNDYEIAASKILKENNNICLATLIDPSGKQKDISEDMEIITLNQTANGFSNKWQISSKNENFNLTINTTMDEQIVKKWPAIQIFEGSCTVSGTFHSESIDGFCFSEQNP